MFIALVLAVFLTCLFLAAFVLIGCLRGGFGLLYSLPSYGLIAVAGLLSVFARRPKANPPDLLCLASSATFLGYILVRAYCSPIQYLAYADIYLVAAGLTVYLLVSFHLVDSPFRVAVVAVWLLLGVANTGIGIVQYTEGNNFMAFAFLPREDYGVRASGFYRNPDHCACFLNVCVLMGFSLVCWGRCKVWVRMVVGYISLFCIFGLILSGSRGGYLSVATGIVTFCTLNLWLVKKRSSFDFPLISVLAATGICILAASIGFFMTHQDFIEYRMSQTFVSDDSRIGMWHAALKQFSLNPWIGTGSGTYLYYGRLFRALRMMLDPQYAHNDYLHLLAEYGMVGAATFCLFLGTHLWSISRSFVGIAPDWRVNGLVQSNSLALAIGATSSLAGYIVHSIFDFNLHIPANALVLAFCLGILANPNLRMSSSRNADYSMGHYLVWTPFVLGFWICITGLPLLPGEFYEEKVLAALRYQKYSEAILLAERGLRVEKRNPFLYLYGGSAKSFTADPLLNPAISMKEKETLLKASLNDYRKGLDIFPEDENLLLGMALALDGLEQYDNGEGYFQRALVWDPNSTQTRFYYARHLHAQGKLDAAETEYRKSLEVWPLRGAELGLERVLKEKAATPDQKVSQ